MAVSGGAKGTIDEEPSSCSDSIREDNDNTTIPKSNANAAKPLERYSSETTPLLLLESKPRFRIDNEICDNRQQPNSVDSKEDPTPIAMASYKRGDCLVPDDIPVCLEKCIRYHVPMIRWIATTILLAMGFVVAWTGDNNYSSTTSSLLLPPTEGNNNNNKNSADIEALGDFLGSSLEGLPNAAVASDQSVCSRIGTDIMKQKGGNAVDAAVATVLCLGVASPASSGLGGGSFLLVRSGKTHFQEKQRNNNHAPTVAFVDARTETEKAEQDDDQEFMTEAIDCREVAPEASSRDMYTGLPRSASMLGGLSIGVPGEVRIHDCHCVCVCVCVCVCAGSTFVIVEPNAHFVITYFFSYMLLFVYPAPRTRTCPHQTRKASLERSCRTCHAAGS